jgi:L-amino acid N-acyltransferase YncA
LTTVRSLIVASAPDAFASIGCPGMLRRWLDGLASSEVVATRLADPSALVLVAERAGTAIGTATAYFNGRPPSPVVLPARSVEFGSLYCTQRGVGVGGQLLDVLLAAAYARSAPTAFFETAPGNEAMVMLAQSRGFAPVGDYQDTRFFVGSTFQVRARPLG